MNEDAPRVSVCLRVYDGEPYLGDAVRSVLAQTYRDFELIVVDDGSSDGTARTLASFDDPRMRVVRVAHGGLSRATARAVAESRGTYIAIMDADDVAAPDRLARQVAVLESEPDVVIVGSAMTIVDATGATKGVRRYPLDDASLRRALLLYNPFGHPTVVFRAAALRACGSYSERFGTVEDYELYFRLLRLGEGRNVDAPLVRYRVHANSVKSSKTKLQLRETIALRRLACERLGWRPDVRSRLVDVVQRALVLLPAAFVAFAFERAFYRKAPR